MSKAASKPSQPSGKIEFTYKLVGEADFDVCAVKLPPKVHAALGGDKARIPVAGTADGRPIRTSAMPMGGCHMFVFNREMRDAVGKGAGDTVRFALWRDTEPRTIETPADFKKALAKNAKAKAAFEAFSFTHRKEYVKWIEEAKKSETRATRIEKAIAMIAAGKTRQSRHEHRACTTEPHHRRAQG